jgi:hypothetical protein
LFAGARLEKCLHVANHTLEDGILQTLKALNAEEDVVEVEAVEEAEAEAEDVDVVAKPDKFLKLN